MRNKKLYTSIAIFLTCLITCANNYAGNITTELSRDKIALTDTVTLSYTFNGSANDVTPNFTSLEKDFRILGTNYGSAMNMINGSITAQTFWRITLLPKRKGELVIPPILFGNETSTPRKIIVDDVANSLPADKQTQPIFVQANINTVTPYVQSQVIYTFKLYYQTSQIENPRVQVPKIADGTFIQLGEGQNYQTIVKGAAFNVIEKSFAFFPQKTGKIYIPATRFNAFVYDFNSSAMNDPFGIATPKPLSLVTQDFTLNVQAIPHAFNGTTWLPAKNLALTQTWSSDPASVELGNPITRTLRIDAQGLRADQIPDFIIDKMPGVNVYVDAPKRNNAIQGDSLTGTLEQKVTYIPNTAQALTIPGMAVKWWNLQTNTNEVAELSAQSMRVIGKPANVVTPTQTNQLPTINAVNPTVPLPKPSVNTSAFYSSIWFWIASALLLIWLFTLWLIWGRKLTRQTTSAAEKTVAIPSPELSEDNFVKACQRGEAVTAQQFLLSWARKNWHEPILNLEKLREIIDDEHFKAELTGLEQAIYAKTHRPWNGEGLLLAYRKNNKRKKGQGVKLKNSDPLPPLNP